MFEKIRDYLINKSKSEKKPTIVCIHGFGKRRSDEYINFVNYFGKDYEIITPLLFDQRDLEDIDAKEWIHRAEFYIENHPEKEFIVVGFSMGGVIASYIASTHDNIKRLILLEPAFDYLTLTTVKQTAKDSFRKKEELDEYISLPRGFMRTFMKVVNSCRESIRIVNCPTLFIHCVDDELIPYSASIKAYNRMVSDNKRLFILGEGCHRVMDDEKNRKLCFKLIEDFLNNNLN